MLAFQLRFKHDLPRPILDANHCFARVAEQIQNDLLKLHAIAVDSWQ